MTQHCNENADAILNCRQNSESESKRCVLKVKKEEIHFKYLNTNFIGFSGIVMFTGGGVICPRHFV
jgi:hypothetical protein